MLSEIKIISSEVDYMDRMMIPSVGIIFSMQTFRVLRANWKCRKMASFHVENSHPQPQHVTQQRLPSRKSLSIVKYSVLVLTCMCLVLEIIQIILGARAGNIFADFHIFIDDNFHSLTEFILAVGITMLIIVLFGSVGILIESTMVIVIYIMLFTILVILEIIVAISAYIMTNQVDNMVDVRMNYAFSQFQNNLSVQNSIHYMQQTLECCGMHSYSDWFEFNLGGRVPYSCFPSQNPSNSPFSLGCLNQMSKVIGYVLNLIASGTTIIIIFQIICIVSAVVFVIKLKNFKKQLVLHHSSNLRGVSMHTLPPTTQEKVRF